MFREFGIFTPKNMDFGLIKTHYEKTMLYCPDDGDPFYRNYR